MIFLSFSQVFACIELLLSLGADPNFVPDRCPSIAHDLEWTKAYENKLLQQEGKTFESKAITFISFSYVFFTIDRPGAPWQYVLHKVLRYCQIIFYQYECNSYSVKIIDHLFV